MPRLRRQRPVPPDEPAESTAESDDSASPPARNMSLRRTLPFGINWPAALVILALIALTVFALLSNQGLLPTEVLLWWPAVIVIPAGIWFFASLARQNPQSLIGSAALLGLSISLLLASQNIAPLGTTFVGVTFIAAGTGIILRGLLLRHQPVN